ncbi:Proline 4-hydroxylase (includes Rps23 Pro-64 3,4-dihydroxylase Tpa1), contains SM-20 domain [Thalassovita litoralis]|jgi:Rps23 Pro-64 3,4-dihydroxylase Tpa1-like proline 4-hydroxylase|uniref:Proline 4-hydroxylase (Includes Rps23 Pro-64 3,4-dihydroxylase Tpa1), contains SM-20 domain n=1 Tax=Thalassovita litoralis TaxID=1010611 RepID=A0A521B9F0_9RHOB|nr:2OG-Fe(II) oxygenase [Thalassovita litoralis]SMO43340.1 Proline 4-hydroxylase (includes Rps23 Pro-64 3,4-dihydroxylase Tpa1), contains SM-20 domain [Thalassovita litoralis]
MPEAHYPLDPSTLLLSSDKAREIGRSHAEAYQSGQPYHHICIDNFLPETVVDHVIADMAHLPQSESNFSRPQENLKSSFNPDRLPDFTRHLFNSFNSRHFIFFLEEMTGIKGLIPDPYFVGAGIHKTLNGGHLDIHADFNVHKAMRLERRLNVLIYLNKDWQPEYGGSFEVWDNDMTRKMASFTPTYNRMVCFSTGSDTFHGNPEPVNHPDGEPRLSIALYYYTATWDDTRIEHTTLFKPRPGTKDQKDKKVAREQVLKEILPPFVFRKLIGRLQRLGF